MNLLMRLCYFGVYNPNYSRNRVILKGLRENGVEVVECNTPSDTANKPSPSLLRYTKKYLLLAQKHAKTYYDVIVAGYPGQFVMPLAKVIAREPIILDAFLGMYETFIDYEPESRDSCTAKAWYYLDNYALRSASLTLSITNTYTNYFCDQFKLEPTKFRRVFVGSDDEVFYPRPVQRDDSNFLVMFWGTFIPLQGVEFIVQAAKLLENHKDILFEIIGSGETYSHVRKLSEQLKIRNVSFFTKWIPYEELPKHIAGADLCLGIFGSTSKARRVIPNKAFETLAMGKPLLTGDSLAAREALTNMKNCVLCKMADPKSMAESIILLKEDEKLRRAIAKNGRRLFEERFTPKVIGKELKDHVAELLNATK